MKKIVSLLSGALFSIASFAQQIPNSGFNNWNKITNSHPDSVDVFDKKGCQQIYLGKGNLGVVLTNVSTKKANGLLYGNVDDKTGIGFGVPIDQISNLNKITLNFNIKNETANSQILVGFFDVDSNMIGGFPGGLIPTSVQNLNNLNESSPFDIVSTPEINIPVGAVQMLVGFFVESPFNNTANLGDTVIIDNVFAFNQYTNMINVIPNSEYDAWVDEYTDQVIDWNDNNGENGKNRVFTDTLANNNFAVRLITTDNTMGKVSLGKIWWDEQLNKLQLVPSYKIDTVPSKLHVRYKYNTPGNDTAIAMVNLTKHRADTTADVGGVYMKLLPSNNFIEVEQMIGFRQGENSADSLVILFQSSLDYNKQIEGSELVVDSVWFEYPTITAIANNYSIQTVIYPNPSSGKISVAGAVSITVSSLTGEVVSTLSNNNGQFDLTSLVKGIYIIESKDTSGNVNRGKVVLY